MTIKITTLLLSSILLISCNYEKEISVEDAKFDKYFFNEGNIPVVNGKVLNLNPDEIDDIKLEYSIVTPFEQNRSQIQKYGSLNSDGTFELEIDYAIPYQQIWLRIGDLYYAGIYTNSNLYIELDADSLRNQRAYMNASGVTYSGSDGELNLLMNNKVLYKPEAWRKIGQEINELKRKQKIGNNEFKTIYDSLYSILYEIDDDYIEENPSDYAWLIKNERMSEYYSQLCARHWNSKDSMSESLFEEIKNHKAYLVSNSGSGFYNYLFTYLKIQSDRHNRIDLINFNDYSKLTKNERESITEYIQIKEQKEGNQPYDTLRFKNLSRSAFVSLNDTLVTYRTLKLINLLDSVFDTPKADFLKLKIFSKDPNELKLMMEVALNNTQTDWCHDIIKERYDRSLLSLSEIEDILSDSKSISENIGLGQPIAEMPFGAKLYKVDTMDYINLLANIKIANKNKAIIIDFWATWCGPCLREMPHSKKLQDEASELPVEFVYLCTSSSSDIDKWKSKIAEFKIGGTHIFVEQEIESELMALFSASGFPSYVFIDNKGDYKAGAISRMSNLDKNKLTELIK